MFLDGRQIPTRKRIDTDICIIGGGAAGITLACELSGKDYRVSLIESGGLKYDADTQALYSGSVVNGGYTPLSKCRLRFFGGSTNHWGGRCRPLEESDFLARPWVPNSGWPFKKTYLDPYYKKAVSICELETDNFDTSYREKNLKAQALPFGKSGALHSIAFYNSPPTRFGRVYRDQLANSKNVDVFLFSNALELKTNEAGTTVRSIHTKCLNGNEFSVFSKLFVLATGGIENARLLLLSNRFRRQGIGNENDLVGRYFMEHPAVASGVWVPSDPRVDLRFYTSLPDTRGRIGIGWVRTSPGSMKKEKIGNFTVWPGPVINPSLRMGGDLRLRPEFDRQAGPQDGLAGHIKNVSTDMDYVAAHAPQNLNKPVRARTPLLVGLTTSTEIAPNPRSRLLLSDKKDRFGQRQIQLDLQFSAIDMRTVSLGTNLVGRELARSGLGRVKILDSDPEKLRNGRMHHMGTTRMHREPGSGVVDPDCKVHGVSNLFIAGSSVFPTGGATVPTLTIVALAVRLSQHIQSIMKK